MPANLVKMARGLNNRHPNRIAVICSPNGWADPKDIPYALDNGRFSVWSKGKTWREEDFWDLVSKAKTKDHSPLWIACPDTVADAEETLRDWNKWHPVLSELSWNIALVVQDKMKPEQVKSLKLKPDVIFVGGSTKWKWENLKA